MCHRIIVSTLATIPISLVNIRNDQCGDNRSDNPFSGCLQDDIYVDSFIALNVNDFVVKDVKQALHPQLILKQVKLNE